MRAGRVGPKLTATGTSCSSCARRRPSCRSSSWSASSPTHRRHSSSWRRSAPGWRRKCRERTAPRVREPIRGENRGWSASTASINSSLRKAKLFLLVFEWPNLVNITFGLMCTAFRWEVMSTLHFGDDTTYLEIHKGRGWISHFTLMHQQISPDRLLQQEKRNVLLRQLQEATRVTTYLHSQLKRYGTPSSSAYNINLMPDIRQFPTQSTDYHDQFFYFYLCCKSLREPTQKSCHKRLLIIVL